MLSNWQTIKFLISQPAGEMPIISINNRSRYRKGGGGGFMEQYQGGGVVLNITRCTCWETEEFIK